MQVEIADRIRLAEQKYQQALLRLQRAKYNQMKLEKTIAATCHEITDLLNDILGHAELIEGYIGDLTIILKTLNANTISVAALNILFEINKLIGATKACATQQKVITNGLFEHTRP